MGLLGQLSSAEILEQVWLAQQVLEQDENNNNNALIGGGSGALPAAKIRNVVGFKG